METAFDVPPEPGAVEKLARIESDRDRKARERLDREAAADKRAAEKRREEDARRAKAKIKQRRRRKQRSGSSSSNSDSDSGGSSSSGSASGRRPPKKKRSQSSHAPPAPPGAADEAMLKSITRAWAKSKSFTRLPRCFLQEVSTSGRRSLGTSSRACRSLSTSTTRVLSLLLPPRPVPLPMAKARVAEKAVRAVARARMAKVAKVPAIGVPMLRQRRLPRHFCCLPLVLLPLRRLTRLISSRRRLTATSGTLRSALTVL